MYILPATRMFSLLLTWMILTLTQTAYRSSRTCTLVGRIEDILLQLSPSHQRLRVDLPGKSKRDNTIMLHQHNNDAMWTKVHGKPTNSFTLIHRAKTTMLAIPRLTHVSVSCSTCLIHTYIHLPVLETCTFTYSITSK